MSDISEDNNLNDTSGFDYFISKPIKIDDLKNILIKNLNLVKLGKSKIS